MPIKSLSAIIESLSPQPVTYSSGDLQLSGYFIRPAGPAPFWTLIFHHGSGGLRAHYREGIAAAVVLLGVSPPAVRVLPALEMGLIGARALIAGDFGGSGQIRHRSWAVRYRTQSSR